MVYFDRLRHLVADSREELHAFAAKVGIKRCWFDGNRHHPHYDIPLKLRQAVEKSNAIKVSPREVLEISKTLGIPPVLE
jgi:hypothetical protein